LSRPDETTYPFWDVLFELGAQTGADGLGTHLYVWAPPEQRWVDILRLRERLSKYLPDRDVWSTESGFSSTKLSDTTNGHEPVGRERQAIQVVRQVLTEWTAGLPLQVIYDIRDDGTDPSDPEHNFGLLANDYQEKPAMIAIRQLGAAAKARRLTGLLKSDTAAVGLHALKLDGESDVIFVAWMDHPGRTGRVRMLAPLLSAVDVYGVALQDSMPFGPNEFALHEDSGPIFLTAAPSTSSNAGAAGAFAGTGSTQPELGLGGQIADATVGPDYAAPAEPASGCGCHLSGNHSHRIMAALMWLSWLATILARDRTKA
jgi:hypothetical protein